ncbi:MAG UNVERIFIED_CONTAM: hypothetical protein LVT10_05570 [Anaerolineae bacterium]|jgi:hypothetical protein
MMRLLSTHACFPDTRRYLHINEAVSVTPVNLMVKKKQVDWAQREQDFPDGG